MDILIIIYFLSFLYFTYKYFFYKENFNINEFNDIFPDGNRNAGGAQYYHYFSTIKNNNYTREEFIEKNKSYCAVSGSPISDREPNIIKIKDLNIFLFIK